MHQAAKSASQVAGFPTDLSIEGVLSCRVRPEEPRPDPMSMSFLTSASSNQEGGGDSAGGGMSLPMDFKSSILVGAGAGGMSVKREREWERGGVEDDGSARSFFGGRGGAMTFSSMLAEGEHHQQGIMDFSSGKSSWGKASGLQHKSPKAPKVCWGSALFRCLLEFC